MSEDVIKVEVDDTDLDFTIAKLKQARTLSTQSLGTSNISAGLQKVAKQTGALQFTLRPVTNEMEVLQYRLSQLALTDLPTANRELRVILGLVPGAREGLQVLFRLRRAQRAMRETIETGTLLTPNLILTLVATMTLTLRAVWKYYMMIERDKREYEKMVRQYRGWTKEEFDENMKLWEGRSGGMVR